MDKSPRQLTCSKIHNELPLPLSGMGDVRKNWCTWRQNFLSYLKKEDPDESCRPQWGTYLLLYIGPIGQEAYRQFTITNVIKKTDFDALLTRMDLHFIFGTRTKVLQEHIKDYVAHLFKVAVASNFPDVQHIVREKIIEDVLNEPLEGAAKELINSTADGPRSYLKKLDIHEIVLIWKKCKQLMHQHAYSACVQELQLNSLNTICIRCGTTHAKNKCPAHGKRCANCQKLNHFTEKCKVQFVKNCPKCGTDHVQSNCIAYGTTCQKCGKKNHLSSKCQVPFVTDCLRCGTDHALSVCPAQGRLCSKCSRPNHLAKKCLSILESDSD